MGLEEDLATLIVDYWVSNLISVWLTLGSLFLA